MSFIDDILGLGGSDNNEEENTEESGGLNPLGLAAIAGGFFAGRNSSSAPGANTEMGYQGQIPDYNLVREQVLDTYDPDRVPGSRGQRYFSDIRYVPTGEDTANVRQQLFDQANVGPDSLRAANYARMGREAPALAGRGPTGIDSTLKSTFNYDDRGIATPTPKTYTMGDVTDPNKTQFFQDGTIYVPNYGFINVNDPASMAELTTSQVDKNIQNTREATKETPYFGTRYDEEKNFSEDDYTRISREGGDPNNDGFITNDEWTNWMLSKGPDEGFEDSWERKLREVLDLGAIKPETRTAVREALNITDDGTTGGGTTTGGNDDTTGGDDDDTTTGGDDDNTTTGPFDFSSLSGFDPDTYEGDFTTISVNDGAEGSEDQEIRVPLGAFSEEYQNALTSIEGNPTGAYTFIDSVLRPRTFTFTNLPEGYDPETYDGEMRQIILDDGNGLQVTTVPYDVFSDDNKNVLTEIAEREDFNIKQKAEASFKYLNTGEYTPASGNVSDIERTTGGGTTTGDGTTYDSTAGDGTTIISDPTDFKETEAERKRREAEAERERREAEEALERFLSSVVTPGGRKSGGYLEGVTDGMADAVPASIEGNQPAALSDGEFVLPADVVSHLGNGNSDAGARVLYDMMDDIRKDRTGNSKQGKQINPQNYIPRGIA